MSYSRGFAFIFVSMLICSVIPVQAASTRPIGVVLDPASPRAQLLAQLPMSTTPYPDALAAMSAQPRGIVVADATPGALQALVTHPRAVKAFTDHGGWLMLWGLTPAGLADFNQLIGVEHLLRPFTTEEIHLPYHPDSLLRGLDPDDVLMISDNHGRFGWGPRLPPDNTWSYVLDGTDIAPFATLPPASYWGITGPTEPGYDRHPPNMVSGLNESWTEVFTFSTDRPEYLSWTMAFPHPEVVTRFSISPQATYQSILKLRISFLGSTAAPVELALTQSVVAGLSQDFPLPNVQASGLKIEILALSENPLPACCLSNVRITVKRSEEFHRKVKQLLSLGVLNAYPRGKGGIVVNQMQIDDAHIAPDNCRKQQEILAVLLRNLGGLPPLAKTEQVFHDSVPPIHRAEKPAAGTFLVDNYVRAEDDGDDTMAVRRAINAAAQQAPGTVLFSARTYHIQPIHISGARHLTLRGAKKADGMPATVVMVHIPDSYSYKMAFNIDTCSDIAVKNFVFTTSKPTDMLAKVVAVDKNHIRIAPLPRYQDATVPPGDFGGFGAGGEGCQIFLWDPQAALPSPYNGYPMNINNYPKPNTKKLRWQRVPGSHDLEANGLEDPLDVYPGEYVSWMYTGHGWGQGMASFWWCKNVTAENLQGWHVHGSEAAAFHCAGEVLFKDLYAFPTDGYYTVNHSPGNFCMRDGGANLTFDHLVLVSCWGDDTFDGEGTAVHEVTDRIDPRTFNVVAPNTGSNVPGTHIEYSQLNEEAWLSDLPRMEGHVFKTRLLGKPIALPEGGSRYQVQLAAIPPPGVFRKDSKLYLSLPRFNTAQRLWLKNSFDLCGGGAWFLNATNGDVLVENNFGFSEFALAFEPGTVEKRITIRNNDLVSSKPGVYDASIFTGSWANSELSPDGLVIAGNIFANAFNMRLEKTKNALLQNNTWCDGKKQTLTNCVDTQVTDEHIAQPDVSRNYLNNGSFTEGKLSPWTVEAGHAEVVTSVKPEDPSGVKLPAGYTVLTVKVPNLRENTYYQFKGDVQGDGVFLKVADFSPYGGALMSPVSNNLDHYTPAEVTFRTFKGITSASVYIMRRARTGDAFVKNLTVYKLNIAIPPVETTNTLSERTPTPESDGNYTVVDDAEPGLQWDANWQASVLPGEVFGNMAYYRNTVHQARTAGATLTTTFTGSGLGVYATRSLEYGSFSVSIDGGVADTVQLNGDADTQRLVYVKKGLPVKAHTLTLVSLDNKPVNVDALRIYTTATEAEPDVAELLKDFAGLTDAAERLRAIRHLLWWLHQPATQLPPAQVVAALDQVLKAAGSDDERDLVVAEMGRLATPEAVHCLEPLLAQAATRLVAAKAIRTIGQAVRVAGNEALLPVLHQAFALTEGAEFTQKYPGSPDTWLLTGPYGCDPIAAMDRVYPPETVDAKGIQWQRVEKPYVWGTDPQIVDLGRILGGIDCVAFLKTQVYSPTKQDVVMEASFDDGGKVWLNDKLMYSDYGKGPEKVNVTLQEGWNTLLVKSVQDTWGWFAKVHFTQVDGGPIAGLQYKAE